MRRVAVTMPSLATSPIAPLLGQHVPVRGPARMLHRSYARTRCQPGPTRTLTSTFGDRFDVDLASFLEWQIWAFGSFEAHIAELFRYLIGPDDRCIDVGANVGVHSVRLAKLVGERGEVIAIEPDAGLARRAQHNVALNGLRNVRVIQAAAAERGGQRVHLYRPDARDPNKGRASMLAHAYLTGPTAVVPTVAIDEISDGPVALIKIDVEGCESAVVRGAAGTIDRYLPAVIFEYDPRLLADRSSSPFEWLSRRGYALLRICRERGRVIGRGRLGLHRLPTLPARGGDILAVRPAIIRQLSPLIRPGLAA
jgi:FkbM family methyltransferase